MKKQTTHRVLTGIMALILASAVGGMALGTDPQVAEVQSHAWGLSFQQENQPPSAELTSDELAPYDAYYCGQQGTKRLYITFDAGYENGNTAPILDALKKHNAQAAFFVVGTYIEENPELVKRMVDEGHLVGNHTWHHPDLSQTDRATFEKELLDVEEIFGQVTGQEMPKFYRPPEGKFSDENLVWAKEMGYKTILWSLAYVDWNTEDQPTRDKAFSKLLPRTHDGAIVLLHSTSATNAQILDELLSKWEEMGYTFGSLTELGAPAQQ